jgi:hypothetical protein
MPRFFFDLCFDRRIALDPGGMLFDHPAKAVAAADELARHLLTARADFRKRESWIPLRDERGTVLYRSPIDS